MEGREFTVVPMVILTEGVHTGSTGPLYYPKEELAKTPVTWNHKPIVVYHPTMNGEGVSACDPNVITNRKIGVMMNTKFESGRLKSEAWIEKDRANIVDDRIMTAVDAKEMMELSTGVFIDVEDTTGKWKSEEYVGIARNYRPDHLALLPDMIGACSIADGAGLLRNQAGDGRNSSTFRKMLMKMGLVDNDLSFSNIQSALTTALREKFNVNSDSGPFIWVQDVFSNFVIYEKDGKLNRLGYTANDTGVSLSDETPVEVNRVTEYRTVTGAFVGNQAQSATNQNQNDMNKTTMIVAILAANAGWTEADKPALEGMSEAHLKLIHNNVVKPAPAAPAAAPATTPATAPAAPATAPVTPPAAPAPPTANNQPAPAAPATPPAPVPPVDLQAYINQAPPQIREVLNNSIAVHNEEKVRLVEAIMANQNNAFTKEDLNNRPLNELRAIARLAVPAGTEASNRLAPNYAGLAPVPETNAQGEEAMAVPVMTFAARNN